MDLGQADLSERVDLGKQAHFGVCTNVLLEPRREAQMAILENVRRALRPGATLLLLVPSLESALHMGQNFRNRIRAAMAECPGSDLLEGHLPREGVLTQHFLREHIVDLVRKCGFEVDASSVLKLEYDWKYEIGDELAASTTASLPWDWLMVCQRLDAN